MTCPSCGQRIPPPPCRCGHNIASHDIARDGTRTRCSVIAGPKGTACGCLKFEVAV